VKIKGESGEDAGDKDSFATKSGWTRLLVLTAGVIMNVLLAWVLLTVGYVVGMPQQIEELSKYAKVSDHKVQVMYVLPDSPAAAAGVEAGDVIASLDGNAMVNINDVRGYTEQHAGQSVVMTIQRRAETVTKEVVPVELESTGRPSVGVSLVETGIVRYPLWLAPVQGAVATYSFTREILSAFGGLIGDLFRRAPVSVDFSGPVGIAVITGEVAQMGMQYLLQFTALLSLNLAVINILPLPALDGGRVLFLVIEKIRGRAMDRRTELLTHNIGFALLMLLVILVTVKDLGRFF